MTNKHLLIILAICTIGCATEKQLQKAETKLAQAGRLPKICADRFPSRDSVIVKDSLIVDTFLLGDTFDTIRVNDTVYITKNIPIVKIKIRTQIVYKQDKAKVDALQNELDKSRQEFASLSGKHTDLVKELEAWKKTAKLRLWWLWIVICLAIGWTFRSFIQRIPFLR